MGFFRLKRNAGPKVKTPRTPLRDGEGAGGTNSLAPIKYMRSFRFTQEIVLQSLSESEDLGHQPPFSWTKPAGAVGGR